MAKKKETEVKEIVKKAPIVEKKTYILLGDYKSGKKILKKGTKVKLTPIQADYLRTFKKI
jgi:hypothetical protein